jgi:hypothetical protein
MYFHYLFFVDGAVVVRTARANYVTLKLSRKQKYPNVEETIMERGEFNVSDLNSFNGFVIDGIDSGDSLGISVSAAGDVNGDDIDDLIIGARGADPNGITNAGKSYVVFGGENVVFGGIFNLSTLNGSNGFVLNGIASNDYSGDRVSSLGDINGDGFDDLIIGAFGAFRGGPNGIYAAGQSYVIFGGSSVGNSGSLNLSTLNGSNGFVVNGIAAGDILGDSVSGLGDINSDGFNDLIIGASNANPNGINAAGQSYVIFGDRNVGSDGSLNLSTLDGNNGFVINGINAIDLLGSDVSNAGDINGDGIDDFIFVRLRADPNGITDAGISYVVFGDVTVGSEGIFNLFTLNGTNGFAINGFVSISSGISVSAAGDVNGDGFGDLILGVSGENPNGFFSGKSYVVFGDRTVGNAGSFNLSQINGSNGFSIDGIATFDQFGSSVSGAGDINGDGFDDVIIGAPTADPNGVTDAGQSYVIFGSPDLGNVNPLNPSTLNGTNGFRLNGIAAGDSSGISVSGAGDINNDDIDDLIIGAFRADPNGNSYAGQSYIIYGNTTPTLDLNGDEPGISFTTSFTDTPVAIVDTANISLTDNNSTLTAATIIITNPLDSSAESLSANTGNTSISASYNAATGTLTLTGRDTIANYQQVLQSITYNNTLSLPATTERIIEFVIDDGQAFSNTSAVTTTTLSINANTSIVDGTPSRDTLSGTPIDDRIAGFQGADILTGGGGNNVFVYNSIRDAGDRIIDFEVGADVILLSRSLFQAPPNFNYDIATNGGFLGFRTQANDTTILVDPDGTAGFALPTPLITVIGVGVSALDNANNFVL